MKDEIELVGKTYKSKRALCNRFGVSPTALERWKGKGVLPNPVKIGKTNYHDEVELETRLTNSTHTP